MEQNSQRFNNRGKLKLPQWAERREDILKVGTRTLPRLNVRKRAKGEEFAVGLEQITKYGETPEESLMALAPEGSTPERLIYGWLKLRKVNFGFQVALMGGRVPGGAIVDFMIYDREPNLIIRVMGYWHEMTGQKAHDDLQYDALEASGYDIADVWEYEVNSWQKVNRKMLEILYGFNKYRGGGAAAGYAYQEPREVCPYCGDPFCVKCDFGEW